LIIDAISAQAGSRWLRISRDVIALINKSKKKVLSLDIPSGVNGNTGDVMAQQLKAGYT